MRTPTKVGMSDPRAAATEVLLEAAARAVGARRAYLLPPGVPPPKPHRVGLLRREEAHPLSVEIPDEHPARRLVLELPRPPTPEDSLVARALVRVFEPVRARREPPEHRVPDPAAVLEGLARGSEEGVGAMLGTVLELLGAPAGAVVEKEGAVWTHGQGRPVLRKAARQALSTEGFCELRGRHFRLVRLRRGGVDVGGLAVEAVGDGPGLEAAATLLGRALDPPPSTASSPESRGLSDLSTVLSVVPLPAVAVDREGRLTGASPEGERLFGLTEFDLGSPVLHRLSALGAERVFAGGDPPAGVALDGGWYEPACAVLPSGGRLFVLLDRGRQETLDRIRDELVAAMAHELRTPVAGVKALLEVLRVSGGKLDPDHASGMAGEGIREVTRLERLVEDLLLTTRAATGGVTAHVDEIALRPVVEDVVKHSRLRYPDRTFEVSGEARATADPALVRHAVWHLVDNAAKFSDPGDGVAVTISAGRGGAEVRVTDEGPGIFSGDIDDLFRAFHRLDRNTSAAQGGAGVGLYLAKLVVEAQDGEIWVRSRLGKGSTFGFRLPPAV